MKKRNMMRKAGSGFTLLEMMLVLLIIGLLAGVAAWNIVAQGDKARVSTTRASMRTVAAAIESYQLSNGQYPADLAVLVANGTLKQESKDAWKRALVYSPQNMSNPGRGYTLYSMGPDGQSGTPDDIDHFEDPEQN